MNITSTDAIKNLGSFLNKYKYVKKSFGQLEKVQVYGLVETSWNAPYVYRQNWSLRYEYFKRKMILVFCYVLFIFQCYFLCFKVKTYLKFGLTGIKRLPYRDSIAIYP